MLHSYIKIALRNLWRNKLHTFINVLGLSIGISACMLIYLLAEYELSFDRSMPEKERIYRVYTEFEGLFSALNPGVTAGMADAVEEEIAKELALNTNFFLTSGKVETEGQPAFREEQGFAIAKPSYFEVFQMYHWLAGDPQTSLSNPSQIVLTEAYAKRYFAVDDYTTTLGQTLIFQDSLPLTVSGVIANPPQRTDFNFNAFISFSTIANTWFSDVFILGDWTNTNSNHQLFVRLGKHSDPKEAETKINRLGQERYQNNDSYYPGIELSYTFQPLSDIHFSNELGIFPHSRDAAHLPTLYALLFIAGLLLFIAIINFINLETAQSMRRAKEVGVRKSVGGTRAEIMKQFLFETFIITTFAVVCSIFLAQFGLNYFSDFIPEDVRLDFSTPVIWIFLTGLTLIVALLAGAYPAFVMSGFRPAYALKGERIVLLGKVGHIGLRKGLIIFQFIVAQALIFGNLTIGSQLRYMLDKDLGFDQDAIVYMRLPFPVSSAKRKLIASRIHQLPEIDRVSLHQQTPSSAGTATSVVTFEPEGQAPVNHNPNRKFGDTSYIHLYGIELIAGRNLLPSDTTIELLINQAYADLLGFEKEEDAIGQMLEYGAKKVPIAGVVSNFHQSSLHQPIAPIIIGSNMEDYWLLSMKIKSAGTAVNQLIKKAEAEWSSVFPDIPMEHHFLDETLANVYQKERRASVLSSFAMGVAILISCLGLLGLISYTTQQRTKEIGIRKVLGASIRQLIVLLTKDLIRLVLIASVIALPLAWFLAKQWLDDFAFHIEFGWWMFAIVVGGSVLIALLTVSIQAAKAALANPVESLKVE